jgi:hypothetical protein
MDLNNKLGPVLLEITVPTSNASFEYAAISGLFQESDYADVAADNAHAYAMAKDLLFRAFPTLARLTEIRNLKVCLDDTDRGSTNGSLSSCKVYSYLQGRDVSLNDLMTNCPPEISLMIRIITPSYSSEGAAMAAGLTDTTIRDVLAEVLKFIGDTGSDHDATIVSMIRDEAFDYAAKRGVPLILAKMSDPTKIYTAFSPGSMASKMLSRRVILSCLGLTAVVGAAVYAFNAMGSSGSDVSIARLDAVIKDRLANLTPEQVQYANVARGFISKYIPEESVALTPTQASALRLALSSSLDNYIASLTGTPVPYDGLGSAGLGRLGITDSSIMSVSAHFESIRRSLKEPSSR